MIVDTLKDIWQRSADDDDLHCEVPERWTQGRSLFGGLSAAAAAAAASSLTARPLRTMQAQLLGPISPGPMRARSRLLREGKTTTFVQTELHQEDKLRATFSFIFVQPRTQSKHIPGPVSPGWGAPEEADAMPYLPGLTPEFTQHLEFRFAHGAMPFQGGEVAEFGGFVRFRESAQTSVLHQIALMDAWPCPTLSVLQKPVFASTVTWSAHFLAPSAPGFHQFHYKTTAADGGFSTATGHMWDSKGTYVGFSEQTVVVFD